MNENEVVICKTETPDGVRYGFADANTGEKRSELGTWKLEKTARLHADLCGYLVVERKK